MQLLVSKYPNYTLYTDACKLGAGGLSTPGMTHVPYWLWKFEWPKDIQEEVITEATPTHTLIINDLELVGLVLGLLVLDNVCTGLQYKNIGRLCKNTSAVSWA